MLLINKTYSIEGSWYKALEKLRSFRSVERVDFYDTTSSAGDWNGWIVQKHGSYYYLILFAQANNYPSDGFEVTTRGYIARWDELPTREAIEGTIERYCAF